MVEEVVEEVMEEVMEEGVCVCFRPPVKDELLLSIRFQSLVLTL